MTVTDRTLYLGKHRGTVVNNVDPQQIGRIQVTVPDVPLALSSWAMPCFPSAGIQAGAWMIPSIGAGVWVEFEQGDPDYPIWTGCYFGTAAEVPALALAAPPAMPNLVLQTVGQNTFMLSDVPGPTGGILLKTTTGALISINDVGITISNGKGAVIAMNGPSVTVNAGALVVT
ncbi:MAG TPA: phage baseplate assembly protein V [Acidimicrobiales bacterium]|nr:phage baseplate assembly protein V [Acidimicrobiales bacterium]